MSGSRHGQPLSGPEFWFLNHHHTNLAASLRDLPKRWPASFSWPESVPCSCLSANRRVNRPAGHEAHSSPSNSAGAPNGGRTRRRGFSRRASQVVPATRKDFSLRGQPLDASWPMLLVIKHATTQACAEKRLRLWTGLFSVPRALAWPYLSGSWGSSRGMSSTSNSYCSCRPEACHARGGSSVRSSIPEAVPH